MIPGENFAVVPCQDASGDEPIAQIIINTSDKDELFMQGTVISLPMSATAEQLLKEVGNKLHCHPDSFELSFERVRQEWVSLISEPILNNNETLKDLGFQAFDDNRRINILHIKDKTGLMNKSEEKPSEMYDDADTKSGSGDTSCTYVPPPAPPPYTPGSSDFLYNYSYNTVIKQDTGFVGLVNQAMTCYLNSLLQTLYMTPEFRNALYRWEFDGTEDEGTKSIPYQLQRLFLQLQTSKKPAVGTTELTTSFGWDSSEAWQQHDVQELCRVMFDALEQKFKNTEQADLISTLYEGKLKDYVKCLECGHESAREDTFLDVPLVVRPFGSSQAYGSVEEALRAFVTPETLQGTNQYYCEICAKKCDAHKGLKFSRFPYLLTLQLKRFDFDPSSMHRIKLNDKVTFPEILNVNEFIKVENAEEASDDGDTTDSGSALDDEGLCCSGGFKLTALVPPESTLETSDPNDDDEGIDVGMHVLSGFSNNQEISANEKNLKKSMEKGPYVYELFSIMVHSGSANGGHYYAYIKSFRDGEWYCFNDAQVTRITYDDIQKTYGGGPSRAYYSRAYSSSTNAYMLMYRQIDKDKNAECMSAEHFPAHIKTLLKNMLEEEERERQQRELDRSLCKIKLFCQHPGQNRMIEMRLKVHKDSTLAEATQTAHSIMGLEGVVPLDCCRLVKYDDFHDSLLCSFNVADDEPIGELLGGARSNYKYDLLLEIKMPHEQFREYKPGGATIKAHLVDSKSGEVHSTPFTIHCHLTDTVGTLKNQIAKSLGASAKSLRIVLEQYNNEMNLLLENDSEALKSEGFSRSNKVFVEYSDVEDAKVPFKSSRFYKTLDCFSNTICIHVGLPKVDKTILEKLQGHENDMEKDESNSDEESTEDHSALAVGSSVGRFYSQKRADNKFYSSAIPQCSTAENSNLVAMPSNSQAMWLNESKSSSSSGKEVGKKCIYSTVTPDDSSQDCDEGLGDSEIGDNCSTVSYQNCQAVHSDQSEDSSLTDSERTLIGDELSPRNNSPDIMGADMEPDVEPLHVLSPDVLRPEFDSAHSSDSNFPVDDLMEDITSPSSPEENAKDSKFSVEQDASCDSPNSVQSSQVVIKRYFRAWPYTDSDTGEKMLRVYVDKRITLAALKRELEPFVGVGSEYFKIYRLYSNSQEFECTRLSENLMTYNDDTRLTVKLERALRKGECKVKIYQLCINDAEPCKYLMDWVFVKGMTVLQTKKKILPEIKESCGLEIPLNRCRLRKKSWKTPGTVYLDHQRFGKDIPISTKNSVWEVFLEVLEDAEPVTSTSELTVFTRRWHPSKYEVDPMQEIVIEPPTIERLKAKLSEISGIPKEYIEFAKGQGTFPCDVSVISIHKELDWFSNKSTVNTWAISKGDDGHVVYYRDSREELKKLTEEEKREITNKENARSNKIHKASFSPRKEKALKIYTLDCVPSKSSNSSSSLANTAEVGKLVVPDLD